MEVGEKRGSRCPVQGGLRGRRQGKPVPIGAPSGRSGHKVGPAALFIAAAAATAGKDKKWGAGTAVFSKLMLPRLNFIPGT